MSDDLEKRVEDAELAVRQAEEVLRRAKMDRYIARLEDGGARAKEWIESNRECPTKDLGEEIANAARDHGGECAREGDVTTTRSWKRFRVLLTELVRRGT